MFLGGTQCTVVIVVVAGSCIDLSTCTLHLLALRSGLNTMR